MDPLRTPLHSWHARHGATLVPFGGWEMPLQYEGIVQEHLAVRQAAGLFDVSHMGKLLIRGEGAVAAVERVSTNDLPAKSGRARYTHLLDERGRILDDVIFTVLNEREVFAVCNAGPRARIVDWLGRHLRGLEVVDLTAEFLCLALQGPKALAIADSVLQGAPGQKKPFWGAWTGWRGSSVAPETVGWERSGEVLLRGGVSAGPFLMTRTGYTGEEGLEIFPPRSMAVEVWDGLLAAGAAQGLRPVGLGARDTLRLEKGYLLSGQDFDGARSSLEANCEWLVKWDHEFLGKAALVEQKTLGTHDRLLGILVEDRGVPRHGSEVVHDGRIVGSLTSGTMSPTLRQGIGLAYLPHSVAVVGTAVAVRVRGRDLAATVVKPPFL